jgi:hypothetical protein
MVKGKPQTIGMKPNNFLYLQTEIIIENHERTNTDS